jgi:hypothetical protein
MSEKPEWEHAGVIGVDAGLCWIGDPCYCVTPDCSEHPAKTWPEFCDQLDGDTLQWNYKAGHEGLGVSVRTGYGDGTYPVFVRRNSEGLIAEVKVVFIED